MGQHPPTPRHELEEAAEGTDFFRTPGGDLQVEDGRDQAEAAGWLPPDGGLGGNRQTDGPGADDDDI